MALSSVKSKRGGSAVWGSVPKNISTPSPVNDLKKVLPLYDELLPLLSSNLLAGLQGQIPTDVGRAVMDAANARAFASGVGGSGFAGNLALRDLGLTSKQIQDQAFNQFLNFAPVQSRTATLDPALKSSIAQYNSVLDAMPNPTARGEFFLDLQKQASNPTGSAGGAGSMGAPGGIPSGGMPNFGPSWTAPVTLGVNPLPSGYSGMFGPSSGTSFSAPTFPTPSAPSVQGSRFNPSAVPSATALPWQVPTFASQPFYPTPTGRMESPASQPIPMQGAAPYQTPSFSAPSSFSMTQQNPSSWMGDNFFQESIFGAESSPSGVLKSAGINIADYITPF